MRINRQDTNGVKSLLQVGELGYDNYPGGGDAGRVFVGTGTDNIALGKKSEIMAVDTKADTHIGRTDNPHGVTKAQVGLGNVDNIADVNKNVLSATKWTTARTISLTGDVTGSTSIDGSGNVSITATVADDSHSHIIDNVDGLQAALNSKVTKSPATDNAVMRANGTTGEIQGSGVTIDDNGNLGVSGSYYPNITLTNINSSSTFPLISFQDLRTNAHSWNIEVGRSGSALSFRDNNASDGVYERMRIDDNGNLLLTSGAGALGYGTGAGGTVTQLTSKSTAVTLNKPSGVITMHNEALEPGASVRFVVYNNLSGNGVVIVQGSFIYFDPGNYRIEAIHKNYNNFEVRVTNISNITRSENLAIKFVFINGSII